LEGAARHSSRQRRPTQIFDSSHDPEHPQGRPEFGADGRRLPRANHVHFDASDASISPPIYINHLLEQVAAPWTFVYTGSPSDPDLLSYDEALVDVENLEGWIEAATKEIKALEDKATWVEVPVSDAASRILPGTWVFKRKRYPDGSIAKLKGRYCVRGDMQQPTGEDVHAPVCAWSSVRIIFILALKLGWYTCTIDFANAFVQSSLKSPVWIHLPRGFRSTMPGKTCLRLKKSLYGLSVAPKLWVDTAIEALLELGFKQSTFDKCVFFKANCMLALYIDDLLVAAKTEGVAKKLHSDLKGLGFELTIEGSLSAYLGIGFQRDQANGTIELTQTGLIQKIIDTTGLADSNPNWTPASPLALGADPDGEPMTELWSYPSVIGMLLYLSTNTRPDIAFAVSQVARFTHNPKQSHATAVKTIVRYLKRTMDKGTIVRPDGTMNLTCHVDADFAGLYKREEDVDPTSAKSRMGFIIKLGNCPVLWHSSLLQMICMSTTEAEYAALSKALKVLIPIRRFLEELIKTVDVPAEMTVSMHALVFEDNASCLMLATTHRLTNRTKYFHVGFHWFWDHVKRGIIEIRKCASKDQHADYLTKGLTRELFERNRRSVQGW
jgi:hypothetical protein